MTPTTESEDGLVASARRGDADAFAELVRPYRNGLFAYLSRSTGDPDEADDLLQLTIIRAWKGLGSYDHRSRFRSWIFTLARNILIDDRRGRARRASHPVGDAAAGISTSDPQAELEAAEIERALDAAISGLPEMRRTVFLLRHHSAMTFQEIADALEIPLGTALSHMHHALRTLRSALEVHDARIA